ncbi:23S rRNA (uracil(747)-C(5))-methyltransferase RlmC [Cellulomonas aerilata]|uniref:23S rRNA (Uracil(747)-C(5))-methyltransferase RlmC n=1 Tax=Cellulomonas aerilata TaxID=515326 RepID=A0A512DDP2_9CELL|nr:23S rRNA (uracil(747)-C(5))-methyltransferase RlmC [Cellulomonas aerilata]GEO34589.1 23S rRNA (uracil(747)-C(5))-methyltransferase RlmC [Cellulomonas aerilata]
MQCSYFDAGRCRSCTLMGQPYEDQLAGKERHCRHLLADHPGLTWLPSVPSRESGYRNKAKMVVGGTVESPTLGILDPRGTGIDLRACGITSPGLQAAMPALASFVTRASLTPYSVPTRRGELKNLLVTESPDGELMLRFVLRSQEPVARIRKHLPSLLAELPTLRVVSANILPEHRAVLEGEHEIVLTDAETLTMRVNGLDLHLRPQSFFQTNTDIAAALYRQAQHWVEDLAPASVWDLYCGVGGFALHCAGGGAGRADGEGAGGGAGAGAARAVTGIEVSAEAVASARLSARDAGLDARFEAGDATAFALASDTAPDLVIVNPPRRGIGAELSGWLEASSVRHVVYSSCNAVSLARDLAAMPSLRPVTGRVLDMFPQTTHYEAMVLLERV